MDASPETLQRAVRMRSAHKGITAELVVVAATELTRERGLTGWSVRDLARRLSVATSAVYHHVGGREEVIRRVVRGLVAGFERPPSDLPWQRWFEEMLLRIRRALREYPGVAHWFLMHGPSLPEATDIVDAGIGALERAGFGTRAAYAYSLLFNQAVGTIMIGDDRRQASDPARDLGTMLSAFTELAPASHGLAAISEHLLGPMSAADHGDDGFLATYYLAAIRTTIRGLEAELAAGIDGP